MKHKILNKINLYQGLCLLCWTIFGISSALAYIPSYDLILSKVAYSQGKGAYQIQQTVLLEPIPSPLIETWWVEPTGLRVDVRGEKELKNLYLRFIYKGNKKIFRDENKKRKTKLVSRYHIERPFYLRNADKLKKLFALWQAGPSYVPKRKENQGHDSFVTLHRQGGKTQYKISYSKGQVWVEQDEFVIYGWKWPTGESLKASHFKMFPRNLLLPTKRFLSYGVTDFAHITLKKVQSLKPRPNRVALKSLKKSNRYPLEISVSDQDRIRKFYEKFR